METRTIGRAIGAASMAFGITDILFGRAFGKGIGLNDDKGALLFRYAGTREVATGIAGLVWPASSAPVWTRFAADLTDIAALGAVIAKPGPKRGMAALALGIVVGVAAMDFFAARVIDRQSNEPAKSTKR
jgi:hypothetical protein